MKIFGIEIAIVIDSVNRIIIINFFDPIKSQFFIKSNGRGIKGNNVQIQDATGGIALDLSDALLDQGGSNAGVSIVGQGAQGHDVKQALVARGVSNELLAHRVGKGRGRKKGSHDTRDNAFVGPSCW